MIEGDGDPTSLQNGYITVDLKGIVEAGSSPALPISPGLPGFPQS